MEVSKEVIFSCFAFFSLFGAMYYSARLRKSDSEILKDLSSDAQIFP
jgi:hypothetical protein